MHVDRGLARAAEQRWIFAHLQQQAFLPRLNLQWPVTNTPWWRTAAADNKQAVTLLSEDLDPRFSLISVRTLPTMSCISCPFKALRTFLPFIPSRVARCVATSTGRTDERRPPMRV